MWKKDHSEQLKAPRCYANTSFTQTNFLMATIVIKTQKFYIKTAFITFEIISHS